MDHVPPEPPASPVTRFPGMWRPKKGLYGPGSCAREAWTATGAPLREAQQPEALWA